MKNLALILLAIIFSIHAVAQDFIVDNLKYKITDNKKHYVSVGRAEAKSQGDLTIPSIVKNNGTTYTVTSISDFAFTYCDGLQSVSIPNTVVSIGNFAFNYSDFNKFCIMYFWQIYH
ncbi:MAG: leucine-rich repeat protein [Bacteroidales bacterium]|nr:leucine-rich repeat protein [Bacteroidales bacterium]